MVSIHHLIYAAALVALSAAITWVMLRVRILDVPNQRSSHEHPVPSSGGLSIVATTYVGFLTAHLWLAQVQTDERIYVGLGVAAGILALVGLLDDLKFLRSFKWKLTAQLVACVLLLYSGIRIDNIDLPFAGNWSLGEWSYPVTVVWVLALTNIYNFMDGLDGLASGTAVIVAACFGFFALDAGAGFIAFLCLLLFSATVGFFLFNFPRAKIFMGDAGSQFVGFAFAALAVLATQYGTGTRLGYVLPLLFFHFLFDGVFTFFRRLLAGEAVTQAHRKHLYQLLHQMGLSHPQVSCLHFAMVIWQAAGAVVITQDAVADPEWVLLAYLVVQSIYAAAVVRTARRRGLLG